MIYAVRGAPGNRMLPTYTQGHTMKYIWKLFKNYPVKDMSQHRAYTTRYEDLCQ